MLYETSQKECERFTNINKEKNDEILKLKDYAEELETKLSGINNGRSRYQVNTGNRNSIY